MKTVLRNLALIGAYVVLALLATSCASEQPPNRPVVKDYVTWGGRLRVYTNDSIGVTCITVWGEGISCLPHANSKFLPVALSVYEPYPGRPGQVRRSDHLTAKEVPRE
jgi:hypothetical protein